VPASDRAVLVVFGRSIDPETHLLVRRFTAALKNDPVVLNLHPAYASVLVDFDPGTIGHAELRTLLERRLQALATVELPRDRTVEIPVCYQEEFAPDLADVASHTGFAPAEVVRLHAEGEYRVQFLGFAPGFAYLSGLPPQLAMARLPTPRARVPAGSVGIGGAQTGVYPIASPGGWRLIGRTPLCLVRPEADSPTLLAMGDRVRFRSIERHEFERIAREQAANRPAEVDRESEPAALRVEKPGLLSTIQDLGRQGWGHLGVSASGAADALALRIGNLLLGNPEGAAAIEMTLIGATYCLEANTDIAITGADFAPRLDGRPVPLWEPVPVRRGARMEFGASRDGARCYVCVRGGFDVRRVLGSASTHLLAGWGGFRGRALGVGDVLAAGEPDRTAVLRSLDAAWRRELYAPGPLRSTPGPQPECFAPGALQKLEAASYTVLEQSNRMGVRLSGSAIIPLQAGEQLSEGVPLGALQVPESGQPIVVFVEHQTTGGYPKLANVCSVDLHRVGQLRPRDSVRFQVIDLEAAERHYLEREAQLRRLRPVAR
jgi:KipI family sensor histidine kinase inhibitor